MIDRTKSSSVSPASAGLSFINDPIFALSTPGLPAAIAIIRMTGQGCIEKLSSCIDKVSLSDCKPRTLYNCAVVDPTTKAVLDEPLLAVFRSPKSFTGEDCAELHLHGSLYVVRQVFQILRSLGFREANPGEFSQRSFLNGKMDLTQAEGLRDLINAQTADQWRSARQLNEGHLRKVIDQLRFEMVSALAYLEARIDFPDEGETSAITLQPATDKAHAAQNTIHRLIDTFESGQIAQHGMRVALIGPPNAGKSTLLNHLIGRERAIVSDIPGTTRDYIEEGCIIDGHLIRLIDTAGIRTTSDKIEQVGIEQSIRIANEADLILLLIPSDVDHNDESVQQIGTSLQSKKLKIVRTKSDLKPNASSTSDIQLSAHSGDGIKELKSLIASQFSLYTSAISESCFITNARHADALRNSLLSLERLFKLLSEGAYDEMLAFELQECVRHLQSIVGVIGVDDILDKIFSEFCVGK